MIWQRLSQVWQCCAEEAWEAYRHGSLPHGAVIADAQGAIAAHGRNRIREQTAEGRQFARNRLAHAELNALFELDWYRVNVKECKLYSLIEPCPMCIGAVRMAHMKEVHFAARDGGSGGTSLIDKTPFFKSGNIQVFGPEDPELEIVLMAVFVEATLSQSHPDAGDWIKQLSSGVPLGAKLGYQLFETKSLLTWKDEAKEAAFVLDQIHEQLLQLS
ncbi:MAG TPA: nucleoside deaminase [Ktedonobacteraceae bacterium]|nr:nucleoside deaminase [Ktedonobacteraceae bacterium]